MLNNVFTAMFDWQNYNFFQKRLGYIICFLFLN